VGSLTQYNIRFANQPEGSKAEGHFEVVSLTGLLSTEGNHVHLSVSDSTGRTIGGHLLDSNLVYTTLEVVIGEDPEHIYHRETDSTYGYKELVVKPDTR
jgi:predicted DNA-binding protein with PD1-like motif